MICEHITLTMETTKPKDLAKAMLKFWLFQAEQARRKLRACDGRLEAGLRANSKAVEEWRTEHDLGGFGPPQPFTKCEIDHCTHQLPALKHQLEEADAMAGYMINYITERAHP